MNKCPCEECISFAICNARIKEMEDPDVTRFSFNVDCDLLLDYINPELEPTAYYVVYNIGNEKFRYRARINEARTLFKILPNGSDEDNR
jgi:hypothetical protein